MTTAESKTQRRDRSASPVRKETGDDTADILLRKFLLQLKKETGFRLKKEHRLVIHDDRWKVCNDGLAVQLYDGKSFGILGATDKNEYAINIKYGSSISVIIDTSTEEHDVEAVCYLVSNSKKMKDEEIAEKELIHW